MVDPIPPFLFDLYYNNQRVIINDYSVCKI